MLIPTKYQASQDLSVGPLNALFTNTGKDDKLLSVRIHVDSPVDQTVTITLEDPDPNYSVILYAKAIVGLTDLVYTPPDAAGQYDVLTGQGVRVECSDNTSPAATVFVTVIRGRGA